MRASHKFNEGLYYFPLMTNITESESIKILEGEHGNDGFTFIIKLWCSIYKKAYFKKWTLREKSLFCADYKFTIEQVDKYLETCFREELFDQELFKKYEILTSVNIQSIWVFVTTRRIKLTFVREFLLIDTADIPNNKRVETISVDNQIIKPVEKPKNKPAKNSRKEKPVQPPSEVIDNSTETSYDAILKFISIPYESRDAAFKSKYSKTHYDDFTYLNNKINQRFTGIRKISKQLSFTDYVQFVTELSPNPTRDELEASFRKMAELGVNANQDIYLRLEACLNMIRNPFIKPPTLVPTMSPPLNGSFYRDNELEKDVLQFFGFNEIANPDKLNLFVQFLTVLKNAGKLSEFTYQFPAYKEFKNLTGITFRHNFINFLGNQAERFEDGKWLSENWHSKLAEEKNKPKRNGTKPKTGAAPKGGYGDI